MSDEKPFLHFSFADKNGIVKPMYFSNPVDIIVAWNIDEVIQCLEAVEQAAHDGYYTAGFLSYEAAPAFDPEYIVHTDYQMPLLWFGVFKAPVSRPLRNHGSFKTGEWKPAVSAENYNQAIDQIQQHIALGETEQVNYTIHMETAFNGDALSFYKQLQEAQQAKYTAYVNTGDFSILSASPELFFRLDQQTITTRPMKGTISRGKTYQEDLENKAQLYRSEKDRTENQLIVDLMQRELEKVALPGSIRITELYELEQYPTVYQMTSTIMANISPQQTITNIFKGLFPCGSITGLPKKETMEIISELEKDPREAYCGAIGFITPEKEAIFNVPIRTVTIDHQSGQAKYGVGGGITQRSTKEREFKEVLEKAEILHTKRPQFDLLETLGLFDGKYFVLEKHMERLRQSASYFDFDVNMKEVRTALSQTAQTHSAGSYKVRLLTARDGSFSIEADLLYKPLKQVTAALANEPIDRENVFFYHKTTNRYAYEAHIQHHSGVFDVLLWNDDKEITEFTTGNIVVELNNELLTPPAASGLLAGTFRDHLLCNGVIKESKLQLSVLKSCTNIWYINSVRQWISVCIKH